MEEAKKLTIIMVGRNQLESTKNALESLHKYTKPNIYKLFFMDNGSIDETDIYVTNFCRENGIELKYTYTSENIGYVRAVERGYNMTDTPFCLTCHNDVVFEAYWLDNMMRKFRDPQVAAVGPVISFAMGLQSVNYAYQTFGYKNKFLIGVFFLARMDVLHELKQKFNEFMPSAYGIGDKEELEFCLRIRDLGYKFEIARDVYIEHVGEKTFIAELGSQEAFHNYQNEKLKILVERLGQKTVDDIYSVEPETPVKLMIGILTRTEYVHYMNVISLLKVWGGTQVQKTFYHIARGHPAAGRNQIVKEFLKTDCTHLLFIDDDMVFDHDAITKLLIRDVDICTGIAYQRGEPYGPCVFLFNPDTKAFYQVEVPEEKGFCQVDAIGGYFFLVKRKVFEGVEKPWFVYGDTILGFNDKEDPDDRGIGEDVYFSAKAKLANFEIWVDTGLEIKHIGQENLIDTKYAKEYRESEKFGTYMETFKKL